MADRFPSLEDFDSGAQTDVKDTPADGSAEDFLAREKAVLGEEFTTAQDAAALDGSNVDLMGDDEKAPSAFDSQFPDITDPSAGVGGGNTTVTGPSVNYNSGYQAYAEEEEEPEVIKEWRQKRDEQIAKRAQQLSAQREDTIKEAQQNIDDFYDNYNSKKEKNIAQTRKEAEQFLASQDDTVSGGTSWDRIAKLVDVSGKGTKGGSARSGKERFREMLTSLRKDEKAPGATGY